MKFDFTPEKNGDQLSFIFLPIDTVLPCVPLKPSPAQKYEVYKLQNHLEIGSGVTEVTYWAILGHFGTPKCYFGPPKWLRTHPRDLLDLGVQTEGKF